MKWRFPNITFMYIHKLISFFIIIIIIWIIITTCFKLFKMATGITLPLHTKYLWTLILWDLKNNQEINPGQLFSRDLCENRHIYLDNGNFAQLFSVFLKLQSVILPYIVPSLSAVCQVWKAYIKYKYQRFAANSKSSYGKVFMAVLEQFRALCYV